MKKTNLLDILSRAGFIFFVGSLILYSVGFYKPSHNLPASYSDEITFPSPEATKAFHEFWVALQSVWTALDIQPEFLYAAVGLGVVFTIISELLKTTPNQNKMPILNEDHTKFTEAQIDKTQPPSENL